MLIYALLDVYLESQDYDTMLGIVGKAIPTESSFFEFIKYLYHSNNIYLFNWIDKLLEFIFSYSFDHTIDPKNHLYGMILALIDHEYKKSEYKEEIKDFVMGCISRVIIEGHKRGVHTHPPYNYIDKTYHQLLEDMWRNEGKACYTCIRKNNPIKKRRICDIQ
jgi:hypothetical protein